jgi:hypothetical protein
MKDGTPTRSACARLPRQGSPAGNLPRADASEEVPDGCCCWPGRLASLAGSNRSTRPAYDQRPRQIDPRAPTHRGHLLMWSAPPLQLVAVTRIHRVSPSVQLVENLTDPSARRKSRNSIRMWQSCERVAHWLLILLHAFLCPDHGPLESWGREAHVSGSRCPFWLGTPGSGRGGDGWTRSKNFTDMPMSARRLARLAAPSTDKLKTDLLPSADRFEPAVDLALRLILGVTVPLLQTTRQLSRLPSTTSRSSSVSSPHCCWAFPLNCFQFPWMRSQFIAVAPWKELLARWQRNNLLLL